MTQLLFERKEKKYLLSPDLYAAFMRYIRPFVIPDCYPEGDIVSIYYDTPTYALINRSMEQPYYKEKLRIRSYGTPRPGADVFLELKKKVGGIVYKRRVAMSEPEAQKILRGHTTLRANPDERITLAEIREACARHEQLMPAMAIIVHRISWVDAHDHSLRLTFDVDARWRCDDLSCYAGHTGQPLFCDGQVILEIKSQMGYPLWLRRALDELALHPTSCSKYAFAYQQAERMFALSA